MGRKPKQIVIPKDQAVFWLDKNGRWNNVHGEFQHKKIIDYFHASIKKDKDGYYLSQTTQGCKEKVYFHYEDTALFVFNVIKGEEITLVLNTGKKIKLRPKKLLMQADRLYMQVGRERIKFAEPSLLKIAEFIEHDKGHYFIRAKGRRYKIPELS
ncbi:MAG: MFS transporter permease [Proteobacteria bacterium]|nr:MFS transporter permease [Pseudomonadota bacterium]